MPVDERTSEVSGFYDDEIAAVVDKSVEEDALDTMLETSVVELDQALGGIGNYDTDHPQQTTLVPNVSANATPSFNLSVHSAAVIPLARTSTHLSNNTTPQQQQHPEPKISSPPKIALLARDKVFQSALEPPPPRRTKARWNSRGQDHQQSSTATVNNDPRTEPEPRTGRWTLDEKVLFLYGLQKYGQGKWKQIQSYCPGRSLIQIKSHGQKVMKRMKQGENVFGQMEEHCARLHYLVTKIHTGNNTVRPPEPSAPKNPEHILVASALCQLGDNNAQSQQPPPVPAPLNKNTGETDFQYSISKNRKGS